MWPLITLQCQQVSIILLKLSVSDLVVNFPKSAKDLSSDGVSDVSRRYASVGLTRALQESPTITQITHHDRSVSSPNAKDRGT